MFTNKLITYSCLINNCCNESYNKNYNNLYKLTLNDTRPYYSDEEKTFIISRIAKLGEYSYIAKTVKISNTHGEAIIKLTNKSTADKYSKLLKSLGINTYVSQA